jgi:putative membrane protein
MFAMLDLILAVLHHLLVFGLFGILFSELLIVRRGIGQATAATIASVDLWYGILAGLILLVGFSRAIFAAKFWDYYANNGFFWAKIGTFALIGLISIRPTVCFIRWRRTGVLPDDAEVTLVRRLIQIEVVLFALLLVFAAAMARGYGEF